MSKSINDLKDILDAKGGTPSDPTSNDLQALREYIVGMRQIRGSDHLPGDTGQDRSGRICTSYVAQDPPTSPLSVGDLQDWQDSNLPSQTCGSHAWTESWCASRTTCSCDTVTTCDCHTRASNCQSRAALSCDCNGRASTLGNACACHTHDPGFCGTVNCSNNQGCACRARAFCTFETGCNCRNRSWCQSRTAPCTCHGRSAVGLCESRTACSCHGRTNTLCQSRTEAIAVVGCQCDARCSCNAVNVFE